MTLLCSAKLNYYSPYLLAPAFCWRQFPTTERDSSEILSKDKMRRACNFNFKGAAGNFREWRHLWAQLYTASSLNCLPLIASPHSIHCQFFLPNATTFWKKQHTPVLRKETFWWMAPMPALRDLYPLEAYISNCMSQTAPVTSYLLSWHQFCTPPYSPSGSRPPLGLFLGSGLETSSYRCSPEGAHRFDQPRTHPARESGETKREGLDWALIIPSWKGGHKVNKESCSGFRYVKEDGGLHDF